MDSARRRQPRVHRARLEELRARLAPLRAGARESAWLLYAWCRHCDDVIDGQQAGHGRQWVSYLERQARLEKLYAETRAALEGRPVTAGVRRAAARGAAARPSAALPARAARRLRDGRRRAALRDARRHARVLLSRGRRRGRHDGARDGRARRGRARSRVRPRHRVPADQHRARPRRGRPAGRVYVPETWLDDVPGRSSTCRSTDARWPPWRAGSSRPPSRTTHPRALACGTCRSIGLGGCSRPGRLPGDRPRRGAPRRARVGRPWWWEAGGRWPGSRGRSRW
jgi:hypothetical protein